MTRPGPGGVRFLAGHAAATIAGIAGIYAAFSDSATRADASIPAVAPSAIPTAASSASPLNIRITTVRNSGFTISWTSAASETGFVRHGPAASGTCSGATPSTVANDVRGPVSASTVHYVDVGQLEYAVSNLVCVEIVSGASQAVTVGVTLGPVTSPASPDIVTGTIVTGSPSLDDVIAYAIISTGAEVFAPISMLSRASYSGVYYFDLGSARTADAQQSL